MNNVNEFIESLLVCDDSDNWETCDVGAFFVHTSIFEQIKMVPGLNIQTGWDYELQIGEMCYSMKLIYVKGDNVGSFTVMWNLCRCDLTFPWEENLTLFVPVKLFHILEMFIEFEGLRPYVENIEDREGIIATKEVIRIVRFRIKKYEKVERVKQFRAFSAKFHSFDTTPSSFYCTIAFPWLQPWAQRHFDKPLITGNTITLIIRIITENTTNLSNNIFDLVAIRMAFCDCRNSQPTMYLQSILDQAIVRSLKNPKYIKNNGFDIDQYMFDKNISINKQIEMAWPYLVYEFEQYFKCPYDQTIDKSQRHCRTIKLSATNSDVLNTLNTKSNIKFKIDGRNFDGMSVKLFYALAGHHNVTEIILDTDYRLNNDLDEKNGSLCLLQKKTDLYLLGNNKHNFIEGLIVCLKPCPVHKFGYFSIYIDCELVSYLIFNRLPIAELIFRDITITKQLLIDFSKYGGGTKVTFLNCKFECQYENWLLLTNFERLKALTIQEQENTWESLFDFGARTLAISDTKQFKFEQDIFVKCNFANYIKLKGLKFILDADETTLQLHKPGNNQIFDLYCTKFGIEPDEKCDYDFYQ